MAKNIDRILQKFNEGKYSDFGALFLFVQEEIEQFLMEKAAGNSEVFQKVYAQVMEGLLDQCTKIGALSGMESQQFKQMALAIAEQKWEIWENEQHTKIENADFLVQLRLRLQEKLVAKKKENPRYLAYYLHYFRFYFVGACFVLLIGLLAFVLGVLKVDVRSRVFSVQRLISQVKDQNFASLPVFSLLPQERGVSGDFLSFQQRLVDLQLSQVPTLPSEMAVIKAITGEKIDILAFLKPLNLLGVSWQNLKNANIDDLMLSFDDFMLAFDFEEKILNISRKSAISHLVSKDDATTKPAKILTKVKSQLSAFGILRNQYGDAEFEQNGNFVKIVFPRLFKGKEVYDKNGARVVMTVEYHQPSENVIAVTNYDLQQYQLSNYPLLDAEKVLERVRKIGIWTGTVIEGKETRLEKGKIVYHRNNEYLIPSLMWQSGGKTYFVSLVKE